MNFFERFFSLNLKDFGGADLPIGLILLCLCVGMIAATITIQYTNSIIYKCIKALVRHKATTPETAKSLKELGLSADRRVLRALRNKNAMLMRFVTERKDAPLTSEAESAEEPTAEAEQEHKPAAEAASADAQPMPSTTADVDAEKAAAAEEDKKSANTEAKPDPNTAVLRAEYYLSPENSDRAKEILGGSEDTFWHTVGYCAIFVLLFFGLVWLLPIVLPMIL